jgi:sulfur-carrier protein
MAQWAECVRIITDAVTRHLGSPGTTSHMAKGMIRYWAAARQAAGVGEEPYDAVTLAEALAAAQAGRDADFGRVVARSSFLIDGHPVGSRVHEGVALPEGGTVEVLPPFAGG